MDDSIEIVKMKDLTQDEMTTIYNSLFGIMNVIYPMNNDGITIMTMIFNIKLIRNYGY